MNEQWTNTPHIKYSYSGLSAHKYPDIENNNLPTWPGLMFCQRRNVIGNVCVVTIPGMSRAAYWLRLPSDQSELKLLLKALSPALSVTHLLTISGEFMIALSRMSGAPACVRWLQNIKPSWCHLLMVSSGQKNMIVLGTPAVIRLSALSTLSRSKLNIEEILLITQSWFCVVNEWDYNSRLRYVGWIVNS